MSLSLNELTRVNADPVPWHIYEYPYFIESTHWLLEDVVLILNLQFDTYFKTWFLWHFLQVFHQMNAERLHLWQINIDSGIGPRALIQYKDVILPV